MTPRRRTRKERLLGIEARSVAAEAGVSIHQVTGMARRLGMVPPSGPDPRYTPEQAEAIVRAFRDKRIRGRLMEGFLKIRRMANERRKAWSKA